VTRPEIRRAVRVVLLDECDRILLVRFEDRARGAQWWAAPGGGVEAGETDEEAARRELWEETGLREVVLGPWIWNRRHVFDVGPRRYDQRERYLMARVDAFVPAVTALDDGEERYLRELRWWGLDELRRTSDELPPRRLTLLLARLIAEGPPAQALDVGV
jgi:8-oxo-dGTP pyrophosphatase MutT (NUDIX family)